MLRRCTFSLENVAERSLLPDRFFNRKCSNIPESGIIPRTEVGKKQQARYQVIFSSNNAVTRTESFLDYNGSKS
jgi:hypothetical protein